MAPMVEATSSVAYWRDWAGLRVPHVVHGGGVRACRRWLCCQAQNALAQSGGGVSVVAAVPSALSLPRASDGSG